MSTQLDVIEMLGNQNLFRLPLNSVSDIYRIFDKCVRIYRPPEEPGRVTIRAQCYGVSVLACDKTFNMLPTVLIENALKYSIPGSPISVEVARVRQDCVVAVRNEYEGTRALSESIFERGVRLTNQKEGSGIGLYLASLVAKQHNGVLKVTCQRIRPGVYECVLKLVVPEAHASMRSLYGDHESA